MITEERTVTKTGEARFEGDFCDGGCPCIQNCIDDYYFFCCLYGQEIDRLSNCFLRCELCKADDKPIVKPPPAKTPEELRLMQIEAGLEVSVMGLLGKLGQSHGARIFKSSISPYPLAFTWDLLDWLIVYSPDPEYLHGPPPAGINPPPMSYEDRIVVLGEFIIQLRAEVEARAEIGRRRGK